MKKYFVIIILLAVAALPLSAHALGEPLAQEQSKGRNLASCLAGWRQFISAGVGYNSFTDYWRDFFLWPMHYADVASIEDQVNKSRYAVMAAFLRCDLNRIQAVTEAYYRLEAELYFVRHFVDTDGGYLHILTENVDDRKKFEDDMMSYLILRKKSQDENKDRAIFSGYFDLFNEKYKERAKQYKTYGQDPIYQELGKKFDELLDTFKGFQKVNQTAAVTAGQPAEGQNNEKSTEKEPAVVNGPPKSLREKASTFASRFLNACVTTSSQSPFDFSLSKQKKENTYCLFGNDNRTEEPPPQKSPAAKMSFQDAIVAITQQQLQQTENLSKADMLARYEFLYGEVSGPGMQEVMNRMNRLQYLISKGSYAPLETLNSCAADVVARECK